MSTDPNIAPSVNPIPEGHHTVTPYLMIKDAAGFLDFAKAAFEARECLRHARPDGAIMHAEIQIGDSKIMIGGASEQFPAMPAAIHLYVEDVDTVYARALSAGGTSLMELADQFYGDRSGGVKDPFGNTWWIATHREDVSEEEFARRAAKMCPS